jgi:hypothetical protein
MYPPEVAIPSLSPQPLPSAISHSQSRQEVGQIIGRARLLPSRARQWTHNNRRGSTGAAPSHANRGGIALSQLNAESSANLGVRWPDTTLASVA